MMRAPTRAAIRGAEQRVAQSGQDTRDSLRRVQVAFRAALVRPLTLALVAGAAGLLAFWCIRRVQRPATVSSGSAGLAVTASAKGLALAIIMRYGMQGLPFIVQKIKAVLAKRAARVDPDMSNFNHDHNARV